MVKLNEQQLADTFKRFKMHPVEIEEKISTLDRPLIIESACPGWQSKYWGPKKLYEHYNVSTYTKEGDVRYPAIPVSIEEQVQLDVDAINAGAAALHHHPRDPETAISMEATPRDMPDKARILGAVLEQVDAVTLEHTWKLEADGLNIDFLSSTRELLEFAGGSNKYCQGTVVLWPPNKSYPSRYEECVQTGIRFMEENDIKPIHKVRSSMNVREMKRMLIDPKVITKKPFVIVHDMGHPMGWPMDIDPWMPIDLITSIMQTKERIPESVIGVYSGGRNWLPITMTAILAGVDLVRAGIEDCYWMYPHKDEIIKSNTEAVEKIVDFCGLIGRPVATPEQARQIMGMKLTGQ